MNQNRRMSLLQGFRPASQETKDWGSNEVLVAHRPRDFYVNKYGSYLPFPTDWLPSGLLSYLLRVPESGEQGSPEMA